MTKEEKATIENKINTISEALDGMSDNMTMFERIQLMNDKRKLLEDVGRLDEEDVLAGEIIKAISDGVSYHTWDNLSDEDTSVLDDINRANYIVRGRRHYDEFYIALEYDRKIENQFYLPRRSVLMKHGIPQAFQQVIDGELDLVTISMPKRLGKTQNGIGLIDFLIGKNPDGQVLAAGAGSQLVQSFYEGALEYIEDTEEYNYNEIFPQAKLVDTDAKGLMFDLGRKKRFKSLTCRSVDGAVVGSTQATLLLYLDDCVSGQEEARNYARLDKKWGQIKADIMGRRMQGCPIVIAGTRYSMKDPIGMLQEVGKEAGWRCKFIEIPALDENDESNWDYEYDAGNGDIIRKGFSTEYYRNERAFSSSIVWESEFQQQPFEEKDRVFREEEMNFYNDLPEGEPDAVLCVVDVAQGGGDYTSAPVGYLYGEDVYIEDVVFDNHATDITRPLIGQMIIKHKPQKTRFESNNGGKEYGINVKTKLDNDYPNNRLPFEYKTSTSNKMTRIMVSVENIKSHFFFRADKSKQPNTPYYNFMKQVYEFTPTGKNTHDDAPDSLSMLEILIGELVRPQGRLYTLSRSSLGI